MATCEKCGTESQSLAYHRCQVTEERVRAVCHEVFDWHMQFHPVFNGEEMRKIADEQIRKALVSWPLHDAMDPNEIRDAALVEAAEYIAREGYPGHAAKIHEMRGKKSHPAADPLAALKGPFGQNVQWEQPAAAQPDHVADASKMVLGDVQPADPEDAANYWHDKYRATVDERDSLRKERDALRSKLAEAEKERDQAQAILKDCRQDLLREGLERDEARAKLSAIDKARSDTARKLAAAEKALDDLASLDGDGRWSFNEYTRILKRTGRLA